MGRRAVRDGYPALVRATETDLSIERSGGEEWREALRASMADELAQLDERAGVEPLVELCELVYAYASVEGVTEEQFVELWNARRDRLGSFHSRYTVEADDAPREVALSSSPRIGVDEVLNRRVGRRTYRERYIVVVRAERPSEPGDAVSDPYPIAPATVLHVRPAEHA